MVSVQLLTGHCLWQRTLTARKQKSARPKMAQALILNIKKRSPTMSLETCSSPQRTLNSYCRCGMQVLTSGRCNMSSPSYIYSRSTSAGDERTTRRRDFSGHAAISAHGHSAQARKTGRPGATFAYRSALSTSSLAPPWSSNPLMRHCYARSR